MMDEQPPLTQFSQLRRGSSHTFLSFLALSCYIGARCWLQRIPVGYIMIDRFIFVSSVIIPNACDVQVHI